MTLPTDEAISAKAHLLPLLRGAIAAVRGQRLDEAERLVDAILGQEPGFADALHIKGHIAMQRGQLAEAAALVQAAIDADFHFEDYHETLGRIRLAQGDAAAARQCYGAALALNDKSLGAYIGLAQTLIAEGDYEQAVAALRNGKAVNDRDPELRYLLGFTQMARGKPKKAMVNFRIALALNPEEQRYRSAYARALRGLQLTRPDPDLIGSVLPLLGAPGIEPRDLSAVVESALLLEPMIAGLKSLPSRNSAEIALFLQNPASPDLSQLPQLMAWLRYGLVGDRELESLFTALRRGALALGLGDPGALQRHAGWLAALAIRNFHAEYLDIETEEEKQRVDLLRHRIRKALAKLQAGDGAAPLGLLTLLGCYRPLYREDFAGLLSGLPWPESLHDLRRIQVTEPLRERTIAAELPALTPIEDATSKDVRAMYEESPFPRWNQPVLGNDMPLDRHLRAALPLQNIPELHIERPRVLVAGCGTGLHAILAATTYRDADVLAIDLSRASLAYGKRKVTELGIPGLRFGQADILKLGGLPDRFDVIESFGVLHHLREPAAGLAQLVMLLKPGGYMMLGLYSEIGRRDVVAARRLIAMHGYNDTPDDIRRFRTDLERLDPELTERLRKSSAFHSLSDLRDLVFHRQEHRYFPHQLESLIRDAGLDFLGFEFTTPDTLAHYRREYPDDPRAVSFSHWAEMERKNPDLFANCYRFWLRKPGL